MKCSKLKFWTQTVLVLLGLGVMSGCEFDAQSIVGGKSSQGSSHEKVMQMFRDANEACPTKVDDWTTLVSVEIRDDRNVEFHYQVTEKGRRMVSRIPKESMRKQAVSMMKAKRMAVAVAEQDLSVQHIYEDRFGSFVLSYTINKQVLEGNLYPTGSKQSNPFASDEKVAKKSVAEQMFATEVSMSSSDDVTLPNKFEMPSVDKDSNPAGVQGNPFLTTP